MKKISIIIVTLLSILLAMKVVQAYTTFNYQLNSKGNYATGDESMDSGNKVITLYSNNENNRVEYALNLSKKSLFGYSFLTGFHRWVSGGESTSVVFNSSISTEAVKGGNFRATIVYNNTTDGSSGSPISGRFTLTRQ